MLSGQGRHRRPRQAPAIVVAAGVTGSAIAIPLLGATGANAAEAQTWDKVAECESGGAWSAKGDGYYGGLQLTQETWENYGGLAYAPSADQASRSQQISVADEILADQGPDAWPNCGPAAGLTRDSAAADVDPGLPVPPTKSAGPSDEDRDTTGSEGSEGSEGSADTGDAEGAEKAGGKDRADGKDASGQRTGKHRKPDSGDTTGESGTSGRSDQKDPKDGAERAAGRDGKSGDGDTTSSGSDGDSGAGSSPSDPTRTPDAADGPSDDPSDDPSDGPSGRHRGPDAEEARDGASGAGAAGRHASRGEERDSRAAGGAAGIYTVRSGDNLSRIADRHDLDGGWNSLYAGNKETVGADPDLILPGQRLELKEKQDAEADRK